MDYRDTLMDMILDYANLSSATEEIDGTIYRTRAMQERSGITYLEASHESTGPGDDDVAVTWTHNRP